MKLGGMSPLPAPLGGGVPRLKVILDTLNADRGTALDASTRTTVAYAINMAIARAISAAWSTNERLGYLWDPRRTTMDLIARWERILAINPAPTDTDTDRRNRVAAIFAQFGQASLRARVTALLTPALGAALVAVESINYASAYIQVPDGSYPWGVVGYSPWSSTVAHVLVRLQKPTGWTEGEFYAAAAKVMPLLDPILPVYTTVDWYRPGPISAAVGGLSAAGFYLDDDSNLDNSIFD